eukprot:11849243-Alexandrium_andersonii.AAC.1
MPGAIKARSASGRLRPEAPQNGARVRKRCVQRPAVPIPHVRPTACPSNTSAKVEKGPAFLMDEAA